MSVCVNVRECVGTASVALARSIRMVPSSCPFNYYCFVKSIGRLRGRAHGWMDGCLHANANDHDDDRSWHSLIDQANRIVPFVFVASARNVLINLGARGEQNPRVAEIRLTGLLYANGDDTGWLEHAHSVIHPSIRPASVLWLIVKLPLSPTAHAAQHVLG